MIRSCLSPSPCVQSIYCSLISRASSSMSRWLAAGHETIFPPLSLSQRQRAATPGLRSTPPPPPPQLPPCYSPASHAYLTFTFHTTPHHTILRKLSLPQRPCHVKNLFNFSIWSFPVSLSLPGAGNGGREGGREGRRKLIFSKHLTNPSVARGRGHERGALDDKYCLVLRCVFLRCAALLL